MVTKIFGLDPATISPDDEFVARQLAASSLPDVIGTIVAPDNLTTEEVNGVTVVVDYSGSMNVPAIINAMIEGYNGMLGVLKTTSARATMHFQLLLFSEQVRELHTFTRLVSAKDNRTLNLPLLDRSKYDPGQGGMTSTLDALERAVADNMLFEAVLGRPEVSATSRHTIVLLTDGFVNIGTSIRAAELRQAVMRKARTETWTFLGFGLIAPQTARDFAEGMRSQGWTGTEDEAAQLLYEATLGGWGLWVDTEDEIDKIPNPDDRRLAQLYRKAERVILESIEPGYCGLGGLGFPRDCVLSSKCEPEVITKLFRTKVSSSIIRASSSQGQVVVAQQDDNASPDASGQSLL